MQVPFSRAVVGIEVPFGCRACGFQGTVKVAATAEAMGAGIDSGDLASSQALAIAREDAKHATCPRCGAREHLDTGNHDNQVWARVGVGLAAGAIAFALGLYKLDSFTAAVVMGIIGALIGYVSAMAGGRERSMMKVIDPSATADGRVACAKCRTRVPEQQSYIGETGPVCEACFTG